MQYNNKLRTIKLHFITITKYLEINHIQFMLKTHYIIFGWFILREELTETLGFPPVRSR